MCPGFHHNSVKGKIIITKFKAFEVLSLAMMKPIGSEDVMKGMSPDFYIFLIEQTKLLTSGTTVRSLVYETLL